MAGRIASRVIAFGGALAIGLLAGTAVAEDDILRWRVNSLLHPTLFGEAGLRFAETVGRLSDGRFVIEVHDRLVLDQNTFGALDSGLIDAVWGSAGHHHREDPALTLFSGIPFGPGPAGFTAWMQSGGGAAALAAIYARHGLKSLYCGALPAEGGGWFVEPVETPGDLDGLAMRSFGYGARVLQRLGVVAYELAAEDIRPALDSGLIHGAEFSLPSIDAELGIADVAPHLYFPGWQQPVTSLELLMPERTWAALSARHRQVLEDACAEARARTAPAAEAQQVAALAEFRAQGVTLHDWSDEILAALDAAWAEVIAAETARDPLLADAWDSYLRFRDGQGGWRAGAHTE